MISIFGDCELDAARCELRRAGATVTVEAKVFKVLVHLIVHRERVVTKDELLEHFWPGAFVSEPALTRCLTKVRQAVHDDRLSQRIIKTVRGHGYRFVAEVSACSQVPAALPEQASTLACPPLLTAPIPLVADGPTTHSVLPMECKDVTVLVAGLRGATALAQAVDAEVLYDTLQPALALMRGEVERFGGVVIHRTGFHLTALFGTPIAQEDHAIRALHAALGMQRVFAAYADELQRTQAVALDMGMGVAGATVAIGMQQDEMSLDYTAQGFAVYLADRLQALATNNTIHVSEALQQQALGFFRFKDLGEVLSPRGRPACARLCVLSPGTGHFPVGSILTATHVEVSRARARDRCAVYALGQGTPWSRPGRGALW